MKKHSIYFGDNFEVLQKLQSESIRLIYIDPPFGLGYDQVRASTGMRFEDGIFDFELFEKLLEQAHRVLTPDGSLFLHIDYRNAPHFRIKADKIFGFENLKNEIIWAFDYGARQKSRWPSKHNNIYWYTKNPDNYIFNTESMERIPYMAPGLQSQERADQGKTPTDVWWHTIVPTMSEENTGYPNQKPVGLLKRIMLVHSNPGDATMDFYAGSGSWGDVAYKTGRQFTLIDRNKESIQVMKRRFFRFENVTYYGEGVDDIQPLPSKVVIEENSEFPDLF